MKVLFYQIFLQLAISTASFGICTLPASTSLKLKDTSSCQLTLKWNAVNGAINYNLQYKNIAATDWNLLVSIGNAVSYALTDLNANTSYYIKIAPVCANGEEGLYTDPLLATTLFCSTPSGVTALAVTSTTAIISWSPVCNEVKFKMRYGMSSASAWTTIDEITDTAYQLTLLEPNTTFTVTVKSKYGNESSAFAPLIEFTTLPSASSFLRKNVMLVIVDDSRYDTYAVTGGPDFLMDYAISRIANEGVSFKRSYAVQSQCAPSRASIATGVYPHLHGVKDNPQNGGQDTITLVTLPEILHDYGYYTGLIGKYHISPFPQPGYDYWMECQWTDYFNAKYNVNGTDKWIPGHQTDVITDSALSFLDHVPEGKPFFLWLAYRAPHSPYEPRNEDKHLFDNDTMPFPGNFEHPEILGYPGFLNECHEAPDSDKVVDFYRGNFALLNGVDVNLGKVISKLTAMGLMDSTLIIFMSDNGYLLGEHLFLEKQLAYEESIRIPIFMRYPGLIPAGMEVKKQISLNIDIAPTILDFAGITNSYGMQGVSLLKLMNEEVIRTEMLYEFHGRDCVPDIRAIRSLDFKYVKYYCSEKTEEFFDLNYDKHENINLISAFPDYDQLINEYRSKLSYWQNYYQDFDVDSSVVCSLTNIEQVKQPNEHFDELNIFPNPSSASFIVHFKSSEMISSIIRIVDLFGNIIYAETIKNPQAEFTKTISFEEKVIAKGCYFVSVQHGADVYQNLIVIQ